MPIWLKHNRYISLESIEHIRNAMKLLRNNF